MITVPEHGNIRGFSRPRSIVRLDGNTVYFNSWTVNLNSAYQADDFTIELPFRVARNVPQGYLVNTPEFTTFLFTNPDILVEIYVGYPPDPDHYQPSDLTRIMYGYMDTAEVQFDEQHEIVTLTGRNMIAPFLDMKTTEKYQNMTSSAIAQMLAQRHGLKAQATQTYTLAGQYYNGDHVQINKDMSEWDLLTFLAEQEGFELRVRDDTLFFGPYDTVVGNAANEPLNYTWGQNVLQLTMTRSPHAAKDIIVDVHSYDGKHHVKATAKRTRTNSNGSAYHERYFFPGLTMDQAQQRAQSILDQLSRLEVTGTMTVAGNEKLTVDRQILLFGVGFGLSESYYVRKATHRFEHVTPQGYMCDVTFSNLLLPDEQTGGF